MKSLDSSSQVEVDDAFVFRRCSIHNGNIDFIEWREDQPSAVSVVPYIGVFVVQPYSSLIGKHHESCFTIEEYAFEIEKVLQLVVVEICSITPEPFAAVTPKLSSAD